MVSKKNSYTTCKVGDYNCVKMTSGNFSIAITKDFGPRVIGAFIDDSPNLFVQLPNEPMKGIDTGFKLYGGHRLWISPEDAPRSYAPDNDPVEVTNNSRECSFGTKPEPLTGIQKNISIMPCKGHDIFTLVHTLTNCGVWTIDFAPWALTMMAPGGVAIIPQSRDPKRYPYAPDRGLQLWPYSNTDDSRLSLEKDFIFLRQDPNAKSPIKIGYYTTDGWIAYVNKGYAFVKRINAEEIAPDEQFPDNNCNVECYSCAAFCEIETLGPQYVIAPGADSEHTETWFAFSGLPEIKNSADVKKYLLPKIEAAYQL